MKLIFKYFQGPVEDMADLVEGEQECSLCEKLSRCFVLDNAMCKELENKDGKFGCYECLRNGGFEFWHDTDIGVLDEKGLSKIYNHNRMPPQNFSETAQIELRRTPQIVTWQQEIWLSHCSDFMVYQGTWKLKDFYRNSLNGDGRSLFYEMTDEWQNLWNDSLREGETLLKDWYATYYVFKCFHCGILKGNWDCD